jgi:hypothetical protein
VVERNTNIVMSPMKIAILDADLIERKRHRFPNLVCMKLSGYYKSLGHEVTLKMDYIGLSEYDKVFISKVFTDTLIPHSVLRLTNVEYGGPAFSMIKHRLYRIKLSIICRTTIFMILGLENK